MQARHVQVELKAELDTFAAWERMSTDFSQLLRAAFKEFHHGCRYYKGQGRAYNVWLRETNPMDFAIHLERADGGRQVRSLSVCCVFSPQAMDCAACIGFGLRRSGPALRESQVFCRVLT